MVRTEPTRVGSFQWALQQDWAAGVYAARKRRGATQQGLADVLGVNQSVVGQWETGRHFLPRLAVMLRTADVLGVDRERLVPLWVPVPEGEPVVPVTLGRRLVHPKGAAR